MSRRNPARVLVEALEPRRLMAVDAVVGLVSVPQLSSNTFLTSQFNGPAPVQLNGDQGVVQALQLQEGSALDLTGTRPNPFLAQTFVLQTVPVPTLQPSAMSQGTF